MPADSFRAVIDVVFPVAGQTLPRDHAQALQRALCECLPWLSGDAGAGIHAIKLVSGNEAQAMLPGRARLLVRVDESHVADMVALAGRDLTIGNYALKLGMPHVKPLLGHGTLYAVKVAANSADEVAFMAIIGQELSALGVGGETVCGKHQHQMVDGVVLDTFSLMLHALSPEHSLRLQAHGLGSHRLMGCGIFVPHRSAAAVGA